MNMDSTATHVCAHARTTLGTPEASATTWLARRRLLNPPRTDRFNFSMDLAEIVRHIGQPEADVVEALTAGGYTVENGRVDMLRIFWRKAVGPEPKDNATRRRQIDAVAAAWGQQLGTGSVGTAMQLGGELRAAIRAALAPDVPSAAGLAKLIRHGQAKGDRFAFHLVGTTPRQYSVRELAKETAT